MRNYLLLFLPIGVLAQNLSIGEKCYLRCAARCIQKKVSNNTLVDCQTQCSSYLESSLCKASKCWSHCKDLGAPASIDQPGNLDLSYGRGRRTLVWKRVPDAVFYLMQYKLGNQTMNEEQKPRTKRETSAQKSENGTNCARTYTVEENNFCTGIALEHEMSLIELEALNPGLDCDALEIGQKLCISSRNRKTCKKMKKIEDDDTCEKIAEENGISPDQLNQFNVKLECDDLPVGYEVCLEAPEAKNGYQRITSDASNTLNILTDNTYVNHFHDPPGSLCAPILFRVAAISASGVSEFSEETEFDRLFFAVNPRIEFLEARYFEQKPALMVWPEYKANTFPKSLRITLQWTLNNWSYGESDLMVQPRMYISCGFPEGGNYSVPTFKPGYKSTELVTTVELDVENSVWNNMQAKFYGHLVRSKKCGTKIVLERILYDVTQYRYFRGDTTVDYPGQPRKIKVDPICGQINHVSYKVLKNRTTTENHASGLELEVVFEPRRMKHEMPTLYYKAYYGHAELELTDQLSAQDVHFSNIIGVESNCLHLDGEGFCTVQTTNTVVLKDIDPDQLYGITLCAIKEPNSTSLNIFDIPKKRRPRAHPILVNPRAIVEFNQRAILFGIPSSLIIGVVISIMMVFCIWYGRKRTEENLNRLKVSQIHADQVEHSKKTDIWEVDRRNLIIYQDNKLGAGAFGAVYLGKLVGRSIGHEHSKSPLGVHLMRVDNCEVAVKMLPEVSFSHSRNEFLREIALMKTLGFHENLMNMLACVTESEPLCLVVEYCNNGDLLRYLRERCEYMMQLTESGVNYEEDVVDMNYDPDQIVTKRQLLAYAVQISFGLEYLAQSGFVHRDVACRNMLLHHKKVCKIGDFGLCRKMSLEDDQYCRKGGRLPLKWMSPESISQFSFSTKSDVWSFGVFLYELVTLGGTPYVGILPQDLLPWLEHGKRMEQPDNCPDKFYAQMLACWSRKAEDRPDFSTIRSHLADQLEELTEEYGYMKLDAQKEYYHFKYKNDELDVIVIPDNGTKEEQPVILCDHKDSLN